MKMNDITDGADLTHPTMSGRWIIGAIGAVVLILLALAIGSWLYKNSVGRLASSGVTGSVSKTISSLMPGTYGNGT